MKTRRAKSNDIIEGQIVVVSAAGGATCRKDLELDSEVVAELATDSRVFVTEQDETRDGKLRAKVFSPVEGWVSVKCLAPICDRSGNLLAAGKAILEPADVNRPRLIYTPSTRRLLDPRVVFRTGRRQAGPLLALRRDQPRGHVQGALGLRRAAVWKS